MSYFVNYWAKANCTASDNTQLTSDCTCGSGTPHGCYVDQYCVSTHVGDICSDYRNVFHLFIYNSKYTNSHLNISYWAILIENVI